MSDFITLSCPSCGGKLQITNAMERFACANCGNEHLVQRQGGAVFLTPVVETLQKIQTGTDKAASELAISRLKKEIEELEQAIKDLRSIITTAMGNPNKLREIKDVLANRRKSQSDRLVFEQTTNANTCLLEIQGLTASELKNLTGNVTFNMIRINLETLHNFEMMLNDKHDQLSRHQKIVNQR